MTLPLARRVLQIEAEAIAQLVERLDENFERAGDAGQRLRRARRGHRDGQVRDRVPEDSRPPSRVPALPLCT